MDAIIFAGIQGIRPDSTLGKIESVVCDRLKIPVQEFRSVKRSRHLVEARNIFFCIARKLNTDLTFKQIGEYVNKNHATVMHGIKIVKTG